MSDNDFNEDFYGVQMLSHDILAKKSCAELREIRAQKDALIANIQRELNELSHQTDFERRIAQLEDALSNVRQKPGAHVEVHAPLLVKIRDAIKEHHDVKHKAGYTAYALGQVKDDEKPEKIKAPSYAHNEVPFIAMERKPEPPKHITIAHDYVGHLIAQKPPEDLKNEYRQYDPIKQGYLSAPPTPVSQETVHSLVHNARAGLKGGVKQSQPVDRGNTAGIGNVITLDDLEQEDEAVEFWRMLA